MRKLLILTSTTLFSANAHLGHRVTFPHIKVYTCGSRNRIAILDSDKILICLRNALLFLGSIIRTKRGRFFLLNTQNVFIYEIMDEMANLIQDSQWKIGAFLNSPSKKNIRSRTNKITLGFHQKPDCVLILDADRKSSVIVEADRSQIPIVSLVDSTTPLRSFQRITYPIPANNSIQFVYLFANLLTKKQQQKRLAYRHFSSSSKSDSWFKRLSYKLVFSLPINLIFLLVFHFRLVRFVCCLIQFLINKTFDDPYVDYPYVDYPVRFLPDLNQAPPAEEEAEPPAPEVFQIQGDDLFPVEAEPPAPGPILQLNGLEEAAHRLVLNHEISLLIENRVRNELLENNVLHLAEQRGLLLYGDPNYYIRSTTQFVLRDIEFHDEIHIPILEDLFEQLQQEPEMLDTLIKDALAPQPPLL
uniref:ribosomal protein S2 n=1 Tax=Cyperus esculentus TaxID=1053340 RepID=UPI001D10AD79|nr:ribosomal protein S2 [Cyperus esculentus]UAL49992.1 ribosomal protein S2 [Cyperus esculentus]